MFSQMRTEKQFCVRSAYLGIQNNPEYRIILKDLSGELSSIVLV